MSTDPTNNKLRHQARAHERARAEGFTPRTEKQKELARAVRSSQAQRIRPVTLPTFSWDKDDEGGRDV